MLALLRSTLTGLILLTAAPALAVPVFIVEAHVRGGTNGANNVVNQFDTGSNSASASGSGSVSGALISGTAEGAASFLNFGGQASSTLTNANSLGAIRASTLSIMMDTVTITSPVLADGSEGFLRYGFFVDGTLNVTNTTNTFVSASTQLVITHDFGALGGWSWLAQQNAVGSQVVSEAGVLSPLIPFIYGTPFNMRFNMTVGTGVVNGPSQDFTASADFLNTITVQSLEAFDADEIAVDRVSISGDGGTVYPGSTVPEPQTWLLLALSGAVLHRAARRRASSRPR